MRRALLLFVLLPLAGCGLLFDGGPLGGDKGDDDDDDDGSGDDTGGPEAGPLAIALVWDNSPSMAEEAVAIARALPALDARAGRSELRVVITTTSVAYEGGASPAVDPGEAGWSLAPMRSSTDPGWTLDLTRDLLCEATVWQPSAVPRDPSYTCEPDAPPFPDIVSQQYLDCLCGFAEWEDTPAGSGDEEPLEAALMLGCRAAAEPPETCFDPLSPFASTPEPTISDWPGDDVDATHLLIVTDEGDNSRRLAQGEVEADPYLEALSSLPAPPTVSGIILAIDEQTGGPICPSTSVPVWSLDRIQDAADTTGGGIWPISEQAADGTCVIPDLSVALEAWIRTR